MFKCTFSFFPDLSLAIGVSKSASDYITLGLEFPESSLSFNFLLSLELHAEDLETLSLQNVSSDDCDFGLKSFWSASG